MDKKYLLTDFIIQIAAHCKIKYKSNNGLFEIQAALTKIVLTWVFECMPVQLFFSDKSRGVFFDCFNIKYLCEIINIFYIFQVLWEYELKS